MPMIAGLDALSEARPGSRHAMSVVVAHHPLARRLVQGEGIGQTVRASLVGLDSLDPELEPVTRFEMVVFLWSFRGSPSILGRGARRYNVTPRLSPRAGKATLESIAHIGVLVKHRHPYRPESACPCEPDYPLGIIAFCNSLSRHLGGAPRFTTFPPSQVACARIVRRPSPQSDEIEQVLRLGPIRLMLCSLGVSGVSVSLSRLITPPGLAD